MSVFFEAHDDPNIERVWTWFKFQQALVANSHASVRRIAGVSQPEFKQHESALIGLTLEEVRSHFDQQMGLLELLTMFELLATTEAILRIEVRARVKGKKKDSLSRGFRAIRKPLDRFRLVEDILNTMRDKGVAKGAISNYKGALQLRNWLAHGRHWHPKLGRAYSPNDVFDISSALISSIPRD